MPGDLGTTINDVESALQSHLWLAGRWEYILQLTEADILVTPRTQSEFVRSGIVSGESSHIHIYSPSIGLAC